MQKALARHMPLVIGSEYRSSQTSCCHHGLVIALKSLGQKTRGPMAGLQNAAWTGRERGCCDC
jgi:hypothetical protein